MLSIGSREFSQCPPIGLAMGGYMDRSGPSVDLHDELRVCAVCFADESSRPLFLVSCDLVGFPLEWREEVASALELALGVGPVDVVITATHTHSGPDVRAGGEAEDAFAATLLERSVRACTEAYRTRAVCARSEVAVADVDGVGSIRRIGGAVTLPLTLQLFYTEGEVDAGVDGVAGAANLAADRFSAGQAENGAAPGVVIAHFQCHPTVLGAANRAYSADYPGVVVRHLKAKFGEQTTVCFLNGACGDISTRFTRREQTFAEVERIGGLLAAGADRALAGPSRAVESDVQMRVATRQVELEPQAPDETVIAELKRRVAAPVDPAAGPGAERIRRTQAQALAVLERRSGEVVEPLTVEITAVSFPGLASYVFWPGEPFSGYAEALQEGRAEAARVDRDGRADTTRRDDVSPRADTALLVGYAGYIGYLPDVSPQDDPSYEVLMSEYGRAGGETLLAASQDLLRTVETANSQGVDH